MRLTREDPRPSKHVHLVLFLSVMLPRILPNKSHNKTRVIKLHNKVQLTPKICNSSNTALRGNRLLLLTKFTNVGRFEDNPV